MGILKNTLSTVTLFAYGTLQLTEVMGRVTGRDFTSQPALLPGYGRYLIRGETYPGIVKEIGAATPGLVYFDVDAPTLRLLDDFEGPLYQRHPITVILSDNTLCQAMTYMLNTAAIPLLSRLPFDLEKFRRDFLARFLFAEKL